MKLDLEGLKKFAQKLSKNAKCGDIFYLKGDLGSGKTTFSKYFINARYPNTNVTSPTFPILNIYGDIAHYDLYRINNIEELYELDILENFHKKICIVEWPEKLLGFSDKKGFEIIFEIIDDKRRKVNYVNQKNLSS